MSSLWNIHIVIIIVNNASSKFEGLTVFIDFREVIFRFEDEPFGRQSTMALLFDDWFIFSIHKMCALIY